MEMAHPSSGYYSRFADTGCDSLDDLIPKVNTIDGRIRHHPSGECSSHFADAGYLPVAIPAICRPRYRLFANVGCDSSDDLIPRGLTLPMVEHETLLADSPHGCSSRFADAACDSLDARPHSQGQTPSMVEFDNPTRSCGLI
jgi:hypothetical protein